MLDNLTCEQKRMLLIAGAAAAAGTGGYYWKQTKGGLGGAAAGGIVAYLLLAQCGPDTTGPTLSPGGTVKVSGVRLPSSTTKVSGVRLPSANSAGPLPVSRATSTSSILDRIVAAVAPKASSVVSVGSKVAPVSCPSGYQRNAAGVCAYVPPKIY